MTFSFVDAVLFIERRVYEQKMQFISSLANWFVLRINGEDEDTNDKHITERELEEARTAADRSGESGREVAWAHVRPKPDTRIYVHIAEKAAWISCAGPYAVASERVNLLTFDTMDAYIKTFVFSTAVVRQQQAAHAAVKLPQDVQVELTSKEYVLIFVFLHNQPLSSFRNVSVNDDDDGDEISNTDGDVQFIYGSGLRLKRPLQKTKDFWAEFPLKYNIEKKAVVYPSQGAIETEMLRVARQNGLLAHPENWRLVPHHMTPVK